MQGVLSPVFRGLPYRERTRIQKLAMARRRIVDDRDADLVRRFIRAELPVRWLPQRRREWWLTLSLVAVVALLVAITGRTSALFGSLLMLPVHAVMVRRLARRYEATLRANGWDVDLLQPPRADEP